MISKELIDFLEKIDPLLSDADFSHRERTFSRTVKLTEEVGELCEAVLADANQQQRKNKNFNLEEEIADVLITSLLIANHKNLDINQALTDKVEKIKKRFNI
ncbi:hypothetical protein N8083_01770 [Candidatus Pacebacteria bacterium]|nr:hypothetical protein [Candidatus Paceibacterota bacterium]